ncbi:hypothetical protein I552_7355 [Mycobacterium xenopi 3993]|nr:hypothetical protein I552_7355 [Mycobacterium xenopi 3993]
MTRRARRHRVRDRLLAKLADMAPVLQNVTEAVHLVRGKRSTGLWSAPTAGSC